MEVSRFERRVGVMGAAVCTLCAATTHAGTVSGALVEWQSVTIEYAGPNASEANASTFLDHRLQVEFTGPSAQTYSVPGFFAGDGNGNGVGNVWRVKFTPDEPGQWNAVASFRTGTNVAVAVLGDETPDPSAGTPTSFDGEMDTFTIAPVDPNAPGTLALGRLQYVGEHYLRWAEGGYYIKGGVDSPENWLGYYGFDNTFSANNRGPNTPDRLHRFPTHEADWNPGDPDWDSPDTPEPNDGRRIIGALNYIASVGGNSIYFLPLNIGGDAQDSWPYQDPAIDGTGNVSNDNFTYDISKLEQWEIVFAHAQELGILLHVVLNEAEGPNKRELDDAQLGDERRLFYREMCARFAHHNAVVWNISEEYDLGLNLGATRVLQFARSVKAQDPYDHPVTVHNAGNGQSVTGPWQPFIGEADIDLTSLQRARVADNWGQAVADFRAASAAAGKPIPVMVDEPASASPTRDIASLEDFRKRVIWDVLISGGGGEWFLHDRDQSLEDFREFDQLWRETTHCRLFIEENTPFWEMSPNRDLVSGESGTFGGAEVFEKPGEVYAIYFPDTTNTGELDLTGTTGVFTGRWYNPRTGLFAGAASVYAGGALATIGAPPTDMGEDWALLVRAGGPRVLFVRGADRSGGFLEAGNDFSRTEQLADITNMSTSGGNHGWFELAEALRNDGFIVEQMIEPLEPGAPMTGQTTGAPIPFETLDLDSYEGIVLGSNNAVYGAAQIDAIEDYVRSGGGVLFISDANFGSDWADAPNSDQQFLDRFGWIMQQDQGTYALNRADGDYLEPTHPILVGVDSFDGEGVSPIVVPTSDIPGVGSTLIVRAMPGAQTRNNNGNPGTSRAVGPNDAALAVAAAGTGRIVGHFDRNTFFNLGGAGTNINRLDNMTYALNLFRWLTTGQTDPTDPGDPVDPGDDCNDNALDDAVEVAAIPTGGLVLTSHDELDFMGNRRARVDPVVDFDWGSGAPFSADGQDGDTFSNRWTGFVRTGPDAGLYEFFTVTNDGARLWVDGVQLVDAWMDMTPTEFGGSIMLDADTLYPIVFEHYEGQGTAVARLLWDPAGAGPKEVIPAANLVPVLDANNDGTPDECECPGDANGDGETTTADITFVVSNLGAGTIGAMGTPGDVNGDGQTTTGDITFVVSNLGTVCF